MGTNGAILTIDAQEDGRDQRHNQLLLHLHGWSYWTSTENGKSNSRRAQTRQQMQPEEDERQDHDDENLAHSPARVRNSFLLAELFSRRCLERLELLGEIRQ